ncbi:hypothetical protein [Aureimonas pseudogalii]|uniref:Intracellular multiplication protein IcmB n=1 Tax=Aureimonas pseudogalii TaxID=1744844 RepID=A0A7W6H803_9HYPH|nr:hypothetical protein [Aureimonas pseudogalii]MBB4000106.1 intracellular multiplication protein IcmB [Aureimonas pseudogalii]
MSLLEGFAGFLSRSVFRKSLDGYCRLVSTENETTFVSDDGSLASLFELDGFRSLPGPLEISESVERLRVALSAYLARPGHSIEFFFAQSPELGHEEIARAIRQTRRNAQDTGLDLEDILEERLALLPLRLSGERCYLTLWSRPSLMTRTENKEAGAAVSKRLQGSPSTREGQFPSLALDSLLTRHMSVCDALVREFSTQGIVLAPLTSHEALSVMRGVQNPAFLPNGKTWKGTLPGDYVRARLPSNERELTKGDISNIVWPIIARQVMTEHGEVLDQSTVRLGDYVFSGFDIVVGPEVVVEFNQLIRSVLEGEERTSWRCSMVVDAGGFQGQVFKQQYVNLFAWTAPISNMRIKNAFERLRRIDGAGDTVVRWRVSFAVWCDKGDETKLRRHVAMLRRTVERWGNCQTDALTGDPMECVMSSAVGISAASTAPAASASFAEALAMAPIARPASPWSRGAVLLRTKDGKLWPYQPGSAQQLSWVDVIVGTPGSGKSVLLNTINLAVALSRQSGRSDDNNGLLPRISIIDIGPSSSGLILMIRDALPVERRHEAVYHRLKMDGSNALNPFDTQLCLRFPLAHERAFLVNLISLICTPDGEEKAYDGMAQVAAAAIDAAYLHFSDEGAKKFGWTESHEVDAALKALSFESDKQTTWWEVCDFLAAKGKLHPAALAQRLAVPTLSDLVLMANEETVAEQFRDMRTPTGETVMRSFQRMVTSAARDFPILAQPTRFDLSNARIISLDLADVVTTSGPQAKRQAAIMYMVARQATTADFWLDADEIRGKTLHGDFAEGARALHLRRVENNRQMAKMLSVDEYHLTGGLGIRDQIVQDTRVGRKNGVQIILASQLLEDFDSAIQELASTFWFCNVPTEKSRDRICRDYNLGPSIKDVMRGLTGPRGDGAPVLAMMKLRSGTYVQELVNQPGPNELWALSTTAEDAALRRMLYERLGSKPARAILAKRFPSGSARGTLERRLSDLEDQGTAIDNRARENVVQQLADDLVREVSR